MSRLVQDRFPAFRFQTALLYLSDHEFRGICHDYGTCVEELRKCRYWADAGSRIREEELRELVTELELEIVDWLRRAANQIRDRIEEAHQERSK